VGLAGDHTIMMVKTAHSRSPKNWLEKDMKDIPGVTWIVMEGKTSEGVDLVCIGYKYNKKKVLTFFMKKGAGSTKAVKPYEAKYNDAHGNVHVRYVGRPALLST